MPLSIICDFASLFFSCTPRSRAKGAVAPLITVQYNHVLSLENETHPEISPITRWPDPLYNTLQSIVKTAATSKGYIYTYVYANRSKPDSEPALSIPSAMTPPAGRTAVIPMGVQNHPLSKIVRMTTAMAMVIQATGEGWREWIRGNERAAASSV